MIRRIPFGVKLTRVNLICMVALLFLSSICFAETVSLKSGKIIKGKISEDTKEFIKIETPGGKSLYFYKNTIEVIRDDAGKITFPQNYETKERLRKKQDVLRKFVNRYNNSIVHVKLALKYEAKGDYIRSYQELLNSGLFELIIILGSVWILILSGIITACFFLIFRLFFKRKQRQAEEFLFRARDLYIILVLIFAVPVIMSLIILPLNYFFTDFFNLVHINPLVLSGLLSNFFLIGICLAFLKNRYRLDNATLGFISRGYKFNIILPIALTMGGIIILILFIILINLSGIKPPAHPLEALLQNIFRKGDLIQIFLLFFMVAVTTPIAEEIIFRVFLLNFLKRYTGLIFAVILSTIMFALFHQNLIYIPYYFFIGIILAVTYTKTRTIIPSMVTHGLYNFIILLLTYSIRF